MYSSTLSLTSTLDGRGWSMPRPGMTWYPFILQEAWWAPGPVWTSAENLAPTGIRSPDRQARSQSLYRLSYPGPLMQPLLILIGLTSNHTGRCLPVHQVECQAEMDTSFDCFMLGLLNSCCLAADFDLWRIEIFSKFNFRTDCWNSQ